ncbi:MAG: cytochrome d ubiquinol oxidase subunit II [Actinomycetota bacterium]
MTLVAAGTLFTGILLYGLFGGADFGAGFWDLTAGNAQRGRPRRHLIDRSIGPVWEANHVWLIFTLVVAWTAFPPAFAAVMRTLYVPLGLAALGIVLRGSGFAFRKAVVRTEHQRINGIAFASSSVVTPFFLGTVAGGVASGRVPDRALDGIAGWVNPTSLLTGVLAVAVCAYLAGVFLTAEARLVHEPELERWFRSRSALAAAGAGLVSVVGIVVVRADAPHLADGLLRMPALALVTGSIVLGLVTLAMLGSAHPRVLRVLAVGTTACLVLAWGVAQYPYLLGNHMTIAEAAAPATTLVAVTIVFVVAVALCVPSLAMLYLLQQRGRLDTH